MPDNSDTQFEQTFADIAFASLQDKAPALIENLVGFQVLDVNDNQTRAVGIFGAKVGNEWIYMPQFFMNGELKGSEMMYLKNQDLFAPLEEPWVHYIINRTPYELGQGSDIQKKDLAGTDMLPFRSSPQEMGKSASAPDAQIKRAGTRIKIWKANNIHPDFAGAEKLADCCYKQLKSEMFKNSAKRLDIVNLLSEWGPAAARDFVGGMRKKASFGRAVLKYYPIDRLQQIHFKTTLTEKLAEAPKLPDVRIITYNDRGDLSAFNLTDKEKSDLLRGEIVVKDHRDDTSKVYNAKTTETAQAPNKTGIYRVMAKDGDLIKSLIIVSPLDTTDYYGEVAASSLMGWRYPSEEIDNRIDNMKKRTKLCVINMEGNGFKCVNSDAVFASPVNVQSFGGYADEFDSVDSFEVDGVYTVLSLSGTGTVPFRVLSKKEDANGQLRMWVSTNIDRLSKNYKEYDNYCCLQIVIRPGSGKITLINETLFVGDSCRKYKVSIKEPKRHPDGSVMEYDTNYGMPGLSKLEDAENVLWRNEKAVPLKLHSTGSEFQVTVGDQDFAMKSASHLGFRQALEHLIYAHGIEGSTAKLMLKESAVGANLNRNISYLIKHRDGYPLLKKQANPYLTPGPGAPALNMGGPVTTDEFTGVPGMVPYQEDIAIPELAADTNEDIYNPDPSLDTTIYDVVNNAAQTQQKEVFDTAVVGSLVKTVNIESMIDKYMGDLILGMDRIGRTYFLFLQHNEEFASRYGQEDLLELEDSLKNTFKSVGELILFLKQKAVDKDRSVDHTGRDEN